MTFNNEMDRRAFIRNAALIGVGGTLAVTMRTDPFAFAQGSTSDVDILNYALTLEYLEAEFYTQGVSGNVLSGRELELVTPIRDHEQEHVAAITQTLNDLGAQPVEKPKFTFPDGTFTDRATFLDTASTFEELGVDAYHGQVPNIQSPEILAAAASIAGVESRHAAILADLTGGNPFPAPVEDSKPMQAVLQQAMQFIQGG
ncbi:MAG: ferritin-like domain-containing protein [Egibacteraceae bacterium]